MSLIAVYDTVVDLTAQCIAVISRGDDGRWRLYRPVPIPDDPNRTETQHLHFRTLRDAMAYVVTMGL